MGPQGAVANVESGSGSARRCPEQLLALGSVWKPSSDLRRPKTQPSEREGRPQCTRERVAGVQSFHRDASPRNGPRLWSTTRRPSPFSHLSLGLSGMDASLDTAIASAHYPKSPEFNRAAAAFREEVTASPCRAVQRVGASSRSLRALGIHPKYRVHARGRASTSRGIRLSSTFGALLEPDFHPAHNSTLVEPRLLSN
jgi:hypothetical protein